MTVAVGGIWRRMKVRGSESMTLVELLTVVVIIGVVVAMLMEALVRVNRRVEEVECLNGRRVWKVNREIGELIVADRQRLARCWECHPSIP